MAWRAMPKHAALFFFVAIALMWPAVDAWSDTTETVYFYQRASDPAARAWITAKTEMHGLTEYVSSAGTGSEGTFMAQGGAALQRGYDEKRIWGGMVYPWGNFYSERMYDSRTGLTFSTGGCPPSGSCYVITYPWPAQNPLVSISGHARPETLSVGGKTMATATGNVYAPVASARESMTATNSFTVEAGTSGKSVGETAHLALTFRLDGTLQITDNAYSYMAGSLSVTNGAISPASMSGNAELRNGGTFGTNKASFLHYQTNTGTDFTDTQTLSSNLYNYNTGALVLDFNALVGSTYDLTLSLSLISQAYGGGSASSDFSHTLGASIAGTDGTTLTWAVPVTSAPVPVPASLLLFAPALAGVAALRRRFKK